MADKHRKQEALTGNEDGDRREHEGHVETAGQAGADARTDEGAEETAGRTTKRLREGVARTAERVYAAGTDARLAAEARMSARPWFTFLAGGVVGFLAAFLVTSRR